MKRLTFAAVATALTLSAFGSLAHAASVDIQWQNPEGFRDVRATNEGRTRFRDRVLEELTQAFNESAAELPADQTLHIVVTDVDLAGEVEYFHPNFPFGLRVLRRVDAPMLALSFELRDANDKVLQSGETRLHDRNYNLRTALPIDRSPLRYERNMIRNWMRDTFQGPNQNT
jgi:hypothetical protein